MFFVCLAQLAAAVVPPPPIVNGEVTTDYPEDVLIYITGGGAYGASCTGSVVNEDWVLAASHCINKGDLGFEPTEVDVYVGSNSSTDLDQGVQADEWYKNPDYNGRDGYNDVSMIHLSRSFHDVPLMPVNKDSVRYSWMGETVRLVGWGASSDNDSGSVLKKRMIEVPLYAYDDELLVTYDPDDEQNGCHGDSGGPVLRLLDNGGYETMGVMDFLYNPDNPYDANCEGSGLASARVDAMLDFIEGYADVYDYDELYGSSGNGGGGDTGGGTGGGTTSTGGDDTGVPGDPHRPSDVGEGYDSSGLCATVTPSGLGLVALGMAGLAVRRRRV